MIWRKILFSIFMIWLYKFLHSFVKDCTDTAIECDNTETVNYNKDAIDAAVGLLVFTAIRHTLKHDMGIRTPFVCFNVFLHYLLICCRFALICAYAVWLYPQII